MKKVLFVFGTRPEAIKLAPLIHLFASDNSFETKVCITAQHRALLDDILEFFGINIDFDLDIMQENQTLEQVTAKVLDGVKSVIDKIEPSLIVVQGDTTSAMAAALSAFYSKIKIVHIEAGLRSFNRNSPFPEEINRVFISKLADYHFAPTEAAAGNLLHEGISENVLVVGNTVIDALSHALKIINQKLYKADKQFSFLDASKKIVLVTSHRRENFGRPLKDICRVLSDITMKYPSVQVIFPVHPNPNVKQVVHDQLGKMNNIFLLDPLSYPELVYIMSKSYIILTDSGGIQEEAPSLGKPVIVMREETERHEGIEAGTAVLAGNKYESIFHYADILLSDENIYKRMANATNPYGDGKSSERIFSVLKQWAING